MKSEIRQRLQALQAIFLHAHVVGIVHVIDANDRMPLLHQQLSNSGGNKTGRAGQKISRH